MDKRFWAIIGAIVVVFGAILVIHGSKSGNGGSGGSQPTNHVRGDLSSKVTLIEYGDYECPVCESYYPTVQQVQQKYNDKVKFQFRNLPLLQVHPNAFSAARAAEAAANQGKFWQMNDALYTASHWQEWSTSNNPVPFYDQYAKDLGLNMTKFKQDFSSSAVNSRINADISAFNKTGQSEATPTFFISINGGKPKYYPNSDFVDSNGPSVDAFSKVLDKALKQAGQ